MKLSQFAMLLFCAAFFLASCGGGDSSAEKKDTDTTKKAEATPTKEVPKEPVNTIVTTPQNMLTVLHKVADYEKWQAAYEAHDSMHLASGLHSYVVSRGFKDASIVLVAMKADDMAKAKAFAKDPN